MKSKNSNVLRIVTNFHQLINLFIGLIFLTLSSSVFALSCSNGCGACVCTKSTEGTWFNGDRACIKVSGPSNCDPTSASNPNPPNCIECDEYCKNQPETMGWSKCLD